MTALEITATRLAIHARYAALRVEIRAASEALETLLAESRKLIADDNLLAHTTPDPEPEAP